MARPGTVTASRTVPAQSFAAELRTMWRAFVSALRDPYRPERFYMRGPGPRWRAKHGLTSA
jgi:hypothetical protein